jgi:transcriptional regulator with XRE-family HTH domain
MTQNSSFTPAGLSKLAQIVKAARGRLSVRGFATQVGVSHTIINKIEQEKAKAPEVSTLERLAPFTPYSLEELLAIATERTNPEKKEIVTAEDLLPYLLQLPLSELGRLIQLIGEIVINRSSGS